MSLLALLVALAFPQPFGPIAELPPCTFHHRQHVMLQGNAEHARPWLWVSKLNQSGRLALIDHQAGYGDDMFIFSHSYVLEPGTPAIVTSACPQDDRRLIGVRVLAGPYINVDGFVDAKDAR